MPVRLWASACRRSGSGTRRERSRPSGLTATSAVSRSPRSTVLRPTTAHRKLLRSFTAALARRNRARTLSVRSEESLNTARKRARRQNSTKRLPPASTSTGLSSRSFSRGSLTKMSPGSSSSSRTESPASASRCSQSIAIASVSRSSS